MIELYLKELLREGLILKPRPSKVHNMMSLTVKESKNSRSDELCEFTILDLPADSIAFTLDPDNIPFSKLSRELNKKKYQNFTWLFKNEPKKNVKDDPNRGKIDTDKKSDLVLITKHNGDNYIIVGELKSRRLKPKEYQAQLVNSLLIVKYIIDILELHYLKYELNPVFRLVLFSNSENADRIKRRNITYNQINNLKILKYPLIISEKKLFVSKVKVENGKNYRFKYIIEEIRKNAKCSNLFFD